MDIYGAVRKVGLLSIGSGVAMMIAPRTMARTYGLIESRTLVRLMGLRDVVIGAGILGGNAKDWMLYRTVSDAADVSMMAIKVVRGPHRPVVRFVIGVAGVTGLAALTRALPPSPSA